MNTSKLVGQRAAISLARQRGASLLEGIAYLGIAAIVVLGAVSLLTGAFTSAQSNRVTEEVVSIRTAVKKLYMGQSSGYGLTGTNLMPILVPSKVLPTTITVDTTTNAATNAWGGTVTVTGNNGSKFDIAYTQVPQDACINVLSGASGWDQIVGAIKVRTFPITPDDANKLCAAATNTITWTSL